MAANSLSELAEVAVQIARAEAALTALKAERLALIVALLAAGYTEREVALGAGLSGPRINQIKKESVNG